MEGSLHGNATLRAIETAASHMAWQQHVGTPLPLRNQETSTTHVEPLTPRPYSGDND